jgi:hypothetical protein
VTVVAWTAFGIFCVLLFLIGLLCWAIAAIAYLIEQEAAPQHEMPPAPIGVDGDGARGNGPALVAPGSTSNPDGVGRRGPGPTTRR